MIQIFQQRDKCIGCNACVEAISSRWRISRKDGKSILVEGSRKKNNLYYVTVGDDERVNNIRAAQNCPTRVIQIVQL